MRHPARWFGGAIVVALAVGVGLPADPVQLEGSFVWEREDEEQTGDLTAEFTPDGEERWKVAFRFDWEGTPHVFAGTARGALTGGELEGEVDSDEEDHKLRFRFRGRFQGGRFQGTHGYFNRRGELQPSGTLTLHPAG